MQCACQFLAKAEGERAVRTRLDKLDIRLLDCLQENNLQTADQLAEQVGRSPSAVARRLRRLRATGAVAADVSLVSEEAAGHPLLAIVHVQLERHASRDYAVLRRQLVASRNVQLCFEITGSFDLMLLIAAPDMDAFDSFTQAKLMEHPAVRRFESTLVKRRVKASLAFPLAPLAQGG